MRLFKQSIYIFNCFEKQCLDLGHCKMGRYTRYTRQRCLLYVYAQWGLRGAVHRHKLHSRNNFVATFSVYSIFESIIFLLRAFFNFLLFLPVGPKAGLLFVVLKAKSSYISTKSLGGFRILVCIRILAESSGNTTSRLSILLKSK